MLATLYWLSIICKSQSVVHISGSRIYRQIGFSRWIISFDLTKCFVVLSSRRVFLFTTFLGHLDFYIAKFQDSYNFFFLAWYLGIEWPSDCLQKVVVNASSSTCLQILLHSKNRNLGERVVWNTVVQYWNSFARSRILTPKGMERKTVPDIGFSFFAITVFLEKGSNCLCSIKNFKDHNKWKIQILKWNTPANGQQHFLWLTWKLSFSQLFSLVLLLRKYKETVKMPALLF